VHGVYEMKPSKPINAGNVPDFRYRKETDLEQTFRRIRERIKQQEKEAEEAEKMKEAKVRMIGGSK
jgi:hypothetical protein